LTLGASAHKVWADNLRSLARDAVRTDSAEHEDEQPREPPGGGAHPSAGPHTGFVPAVSAEATDKGGNR
jgi:hypothetical protein